MAPSTHLSREQAEDLGGEGDQALGLGVVGAAVGRGGARAGETRGSLVQPGWQQRHAGLQHRGQQVKKQQEAQEQEVGLGTGAKLAYRGRQREALGSFLSLDPGPPFLPQTQDSGPPASSTLRIGVLPAPRRQPHHTPNPLQRPCPGLHGAQGLLHPVFGSPKPQDPVGRPGSRALSHLVPGVALPGRKQSQAEN